ncbi:MAG: cytochrome c [Acidobacteria bacterium]|nr:MAG: cytochrome c [Acidobacteriota bacterium]
MEQFNWWVIVPVFAALIALRWRRTSMLTWFAAWWIGMFLVVRYGFTVPVPMSVVKLYMGLVTAALVAYVLTDAGRIREVTEPLAAFMTERRYLPYLAAVALFIPAAVAFGIYRDMTRVPQPPSFARTIHPATPAEPIDVHGTSYDLGTADNPYRELEETDPAAFKARVENGRKIYYENCFYCHGDVMAGDGMFAHALNPIPTNFQDPGTIAMLREAFLFWRIAKGGPGLPAEGGPWASAMPAWENFLSEDEMWNVILFLYEFTGHRPRAVELH